MPRPTDEAYIIDLCDDVLGMQASRGHRFDFLKGDLGKQRAAARLPVDAYYSLVNLVVEYHERQHSEPVAFFDRRVVASGISRGEQRRKYDELRRRTLPQHGIVLVEFCYAEFEHDGRKRLRRVTADRDVIKTRLAGFLSR